jgi:hypothetical protein
VEVRFWVDSGFRIVSFDSSALGSRRLTLRFENPFGSINHVVCSEILSAPLDSWETAILVSASKEINQMRRLNVDLPAGITCACFLRVRRE